MKTLVKRRFSRFSAVKACSLACALMLPLLPAGASAAIYMQLGTIKGEVKKKKPGLDATPLGRVGRNVGGRNRRQRRYRR